MSNGVSGVNFGDIVATIITLGFIVVPIILLVLFNRANRKNVQRAEERVNAEKQQTSHLQKQVDELNERVRIIERMLKETDE
ncbi:hypothetical protein MKZ25_11005 [Solibacillus sp. FSL W7-1464]|uniref:hypothetical protein n=1 Tax=Solibacillus sp. FSL W7-1464 TaxID=2921706 RepID=UPI0030F75DC5